MEAVYDERSRRITTVSTLGLSPLRIGAATMARGEPRRGRDPERQMQLEATKLREEVADLLEISRLGQIINQGVTPPEMLLPEWLEKRALHLVFGYREDGKSWLVAKLAIDVLKLDPSYTVLWMDAEQGGQAMAERVDILGIASEMGLSVAEIDRRFVHVNLTTVARSGFAQFVEWLEFWRFTLVVWDPVSAHFAAAGVNDDRDNSGVSDWFQSLHNPVNRYGGTTICIDHVPQDKELRDRPKGAGTKEQRPRVLYKVKKKRHFDRQRVGELEVTRTKNSNAAPIPPLRTIQIGGTPFVFHEFTLSDADIRREEAARRRDYMDRTMEFLVRQRRQHPEDGYVVKKALAVAVRGRETTLRKLYDRLVDGLVFDGLDYAPYVELDIRTEKGQSELWLRATDEAVASGRWDGGPAVGGSGPPTGPASDENGLDKPNQGGPRSGLRGAKSGRPTRGGRRGPP